MITFCKLFPEAFDPVRGDKSALGHMPVHAFRHCEPMRLASSYGWYVFPPVAFELRFDGVQLHHRAGGAWEVLSEAYLPGFDEVWAGMVPATLSSYVPPFLRALRSPRGAVQVWSGLLVSSSPGWCINVRGVPNQFQSSRFRHYEGIVDTAAMPACPLFANLQLMTTGEAVPFPKEEPLFTVQPLQGSSCGGDAHEQQLKAPAAHAGGAVQPMSDEDWRQFRAAIRVDDASETHRMGDYGAQARRAAREG